MASKEADVLVGRRCLAKGYVDQALEFFTRNAEVVEPEDWMSLREKLLERGRIQEMVQICQLGQIPIPRELLLERADRALVGKDIDLALDLYELAHADDGRWERAIDVLIAIPERKRQAVAIADRYLVKRAGPIPVRTRPGSGNIRAVK